jgi:hypothetical protein
MTAHDRSTESARDRRIRAGERSDRDASNQMIEALYLTADRERKP